MTSNGRTRKLSGKLGFTYAPSRWFTLRGVAAEGMGGLTFDESVRLEPVQLAGFNQAYRTVISESLAGSVEAPLYQILGLSAEGSLPTRTWWGVSANVIEQDVNRTLGAFTGYDLGGVSPNDTRLFPGRHAAASGLPRGKPQLHPQSTARRRVRHRRAYRLTRSELQTHAPGSADSSRERILTDKATLQELSLYGNWNSPTGFFAHVEANWFHQDLDDDPARNLDRAGDEFVQFNAWAGYRFDRNLCEITAGVLNIGDTDYQLSPLEPARRDRPRADLLRALPPEFLKFHDSHRNPKIAAEESADRAGHPRSPPRWWVPC